MTHPTVSVIVPVGSRGDRLERCLAHISQAVGETDEIIVVADGDIGPQRQWADKAGARVVEVAKSCGPAFARNRGAGAASGQILLYVDADVVIRPDTVDAVRAIFQNDSDLAAMFGSYDDAPDAPNFIAQYKNLFHHYVHQSAREEASTFWTGCGAVRRDVFLQVGGFDERYRRPCIEDIEFGFRLKAAGHRIRLDKKIQVTHVKRWTLSSLLRADLFGRAIPWTNLILSSGRIDNDLNIDWPARVKVALMGLLGSALVFSLWYWQGLIVAGTIAALLLVMDLRLLRFFARKRGVLFAARTVPMVWLYYLYSGIGFAAGAVSYVYRRWEPVSVPIKSPARGGETT